MDNVEIIPITPQLHDCPMIACQVRVGQQSVQIFAVHPLSPRQRWYVEIRNQQLREIAGVINRVPGPKIVCGDFNTTTWSPYAKDFLAQTKLRDSRRGFGLLASWPTQPWLLRIPIDHFFVSSEICVNERGIGPDIGSDHLPIVGVFSVESPKTD